MDNYLNFSNFDIIVISGSSVGLDENLLFITSYKSIWKSNEIPAFAINEELKFVIIEYFTYISN